MFNTEILWNKALTDNNVRGITRWLRSLNTEGQHDVDKNLTRFNCWLQCSIELTKKELLTVCFGQCHDLWMFLDQTSFTKLCLLIQKLKNLLFLARWGHTCVMCRINTEALAECGCCNLDLHTLRQHILLGRLVQWWSFSGLLPQYPDANELKRISRMWQEMNQHHKRTCLDLRCHIEDKYRGNSIIQGMVAHMHKQYGPLWVPEDCTYQTYPPPSLHSLLKLVLVPYTDTTSALAIIMYFVLDMSNMQCKDDLLESFCHTFSIPSSFSKHIYGLWLLDNGFVSNSLGKLLSPGTSSAASCHSYAVLRTLLRQGQRQAALKYLYNTKPAIENIQDARLYVDVLLQNNHVAEARILLEQCRPGDEYRLEHYECSYENNSFCGEVLDSVCKDIPHLKLSKRDDSSKRDRIKTRNPGDKVVRNRFVIKGHASCPFSALLYQCLFNGSLTSGDFLRLFREALTELNSTKKPTRMMAVWPKYLEKTKDNRNTSQSPEIFLKFPSSSNAVNLQKEESELQNDRMEVHVSPEVVSSGSTSPRSMESTCSYICSPSPETSEMGQEEIKDEEHDLEPSRAVTQCCSHVTVNTEDPLKAMPIKSLSKESADELVISETDVEDVLTGANLSDPAESHSVDVTQTEDSGKEVQTVTYSPVIPVDGDNFFIPGFEKMINMVQEPHSDSIRANDEQCSALSSEGSYCQDSICDDVSGSSSFLDLKPLKRALPYPPVEQSLRSFCYNTQDTMDQPEILTSCAPTETMQDLLEQPEEQNLSLQDGEPIQSSFLASVRSSILVIDFNPVRRGSRPHRLQISHGAPLLPFSTGEKTKEKAASEGRKTGIKEVVCFRTTTDRVGDCKLGSWWKQALETRRASTGLLPAIEQVPAVTKEKRHSLVLGWPQSHGLIRGHRQEVKQATKEETRNRKAKDKGGKQIK